MFKGADLSPDEDEKPESHPDLENIITADKTEVCSYFPYTTSVTPAAFCSSSLRHEFRGLLSASKSFL